MRKSRMNGALTVVVLVVFAVGCGPEKGPKVQNSATNNSAGTNGDNTGTNGGTDLCVGCVAADGSCAPGDSPDACGEGNVACQTCPDGAFCADGQCTVPGECSAETCDGCCDSSGQCRAGTDDAVCGALGAACESCTGGESCVAGACTRPCGETCAGCCDGETCLTGNQDPACGTDGVACLACSPDEVCDAGQCVSLDCANDCAGCCDGASCLAGNETTACGHSGEACVACGAEQLCEAGSCVVDPSSRWELVLVSATVSSTTADGQAWDPFGSPPDPLVEFKLTDPDSGVNYSGSSSIVQDDSTPTWNESIVGNVPAGAFMQFTADVWDSDVELDDLICSMNIDTGDFYQELFRGVVFSASCPHPGTTVEAAEINLKLQPN